MSGRHLDADAAGQGERSRGRALVVRSDAGARRCGAPRPGAARTAAARAEHSSVEGWLRPPVLRRSRGRPCNCFPWFWPTLDAGSEPRLAHTPLPGRSQPTASIHLQHSAA
jgi:hypothetical protein